MSMKKIMTTTDRHLFGTIGIDQIVNIMMIGDKNIVNLYNTRYEINKTITIHPNDIIVFCDEKNDYKWSIKINNTGEDITIEGGMHNTVGVLELDTLPDYTVPSQLSSLADSLSKLYQIVVGSDSIKEHDTSTTYNEGDVVFRYEDGQIKVYICKADGTMGEWNPENWDEFNLLTYINQNITSSTGDIENKINGITRNIQTICQNLYNNTEPSIPEWEPNKSYQDGKVVSYDNKYYINNSKTIIRGESFDETKWELIGTHLTETKPSAISYYLSKVTEFICNYVGLVDNPTLNINIPYYALFRDDNSRKNYYLRTSSNIYNNIFIGTNGFGEILRLLFGTLPGYYDEDTTYMMYDMILAAYNATDGFVNPSLTNITTGSTLKVMMCLENNVTGEFDSTKWGDCCSLGDIIGAGRPTNDIYGLFTAAYRLLLRGYNADNEKSIFSFNSGMVSEPLDDDFHSMTNNINYGPKPPFYGGDSSSSPGYFMPNKLYIRTWNIGESTGSGNLGISKIPMTMLDVIEVIFRSIFTPNISDVIPDFNRESDTYNTGDLVLGYEGTDVKTVSMYRCKVDGQHFDASNRTNWERIGIADILKEIGSKIPTITSALDKLYNGLFGKPESEVDYTPDSTYNKNSVVYHDGKLYSAKEDGITGPWDETKWTTLNIVDYVQTIVSAGTGEIIDDVTEMKTNISSLQTDMTQVKSDLSNLTTRVDQAEKDITALESTTADHDSRIEALETSNTSLDNRLDTAESDITQIKSTNTQQSEDIEQLKTDVGSLQTDNTANKTNIGNLQNNFNTLNGKVSTLESDNTTNKSDISTLKTNVSSLQTDNTQNKQDITDIKQDITEINETMSTLGGNQIIVSESQPSTSGLKEGDLWIKPYPQQTITFNTLGGTPEVSTMSVDYGTLATPPSNPPQVEGYEFAYWAPAVEKYTVHFNVNGGSPSIPDQTVRIDWYPRKPPTPTKSGTSFIAWTYETTEQQAVLDYMTATYNDDISGVTAESLESDYYNSYLNEYAGEHPELTGQVTAEAINAANERMAATPSTMSATNTLDNITNTDIRAEDTYKAAIKVYTENDPKFVQLDMLKREFEKRKNLEEYKKKKAEEEAAKRAEENKQETTESGDPIIDAEIVSENHTSVSTNNNTESDNTQK